MANLWLVVVTCIFAACAVVVNCDNAPSLAPASDCSTIIYNMADCIPFLSNGSEEGKPDGACCSGFKSVLETDPHCICEALQNSAQLGIELNFTKAMTLPSDCGVSAPSLSNCSLPPTAEPPTVAPRTPSSSPSTPTNGSVTAAKVPAPSPAASGAYSTCASVAAAVFVMLVASFLA